MQIFDSLSGTKKIFTPVTPGHVKMYVCGQTVYDDCHVGHARAMIAFDMIVRYFRYCDYQVTFVRNITDIDDKIIDRANQNHETCDALTARFIKSMHEDQTALNILAPDVEPRATQFVEKIIAFIARLIEKKVAYIAGNGDVCFSIKQFREYGKLSKRDVEKLISGARVDIQEGKENPIDFVLWKLSKPGEPTWNSPWGAGRPGWHIECSAMAHDILGQPFDIHGGGMDLKFPHHENEIAQSESAFEKTFANYWMHVGLLNINSEKMSKSLNNFFTIKQVLAKHSVEVLRYFMLSAHYRSPVNYSESNLELAKQALSRFYIALRGLKTNVNYADYAEAVALETQFKTAMDDDFNAPVAISVLFDISHKINLHKEKNEMVSAEKLASLLKKLGALFGIAQENPETFLQGDVNADVAEKVEALIAQRNQARAEKNWGEADRIRNELMQMNVVIEDAAGKTVWRKS